MQKKFAQIISSCFEPFTISLVALLIVCLQLPLPSEEKFNWFLVAITLGGLPPLVVYLYERKTGQIKDWFITNRVERRDVQIAWFVGSGLFFLVALFYEAPRLMLALSLTLVWLSLLITIISLFWKISVHMVGVTLFVMILLFSYSANALWLLTLLPLVAWARVELGHHTLTQVTVATALTVVSTYFVFYLYNLATF